MEAQIEITIEPDSLSIEEAFHILAIMDFIAHWSERTEIGAPQLVSWIGLSRSKFYSWRDRYDEANEHNALVPRDHWLES